MWGGSQRDEKKGNQWRGKRKTRKTKNREKKDGLKFENHRGKETPHGKDPLPGGQKNGDVKRGEGYLDEDK